MRYLYRWIMTAQYIVSFSIWVTGRYSYRVYNILPPRWSRRWGRVSESAAVAMAQSTKFTKTKIEHVSSLLRTANGHTSGTGTGQKDRPNKRRPLDRAWLKRCAKPRGVGGVSIRESHDLRVGNGLKMLDIVLPDGPIATLDQSSNSERNKQLDGNPSGAPPQSYPP